MAKKILSVALVLCMFLGIFALDAAAAGEVYADYYAGGFGFIIPVNAKGQTSSTEYLYGAHDYLRFSVSAKVGSDVIYTIGIYPDKNFEKAPLFVGAYSADGNGNYEADVGVDTSIFPKNGTYYAIAYIAEMVCDDMYVDYDSVIQFKIVVDKSTSDIKKQTVVTAFATTINGPQVKWYGVKGASKYYVYRKAKESDPWKKIATLGSSARNYVDKSVASKTGAYIYTVKAVKADGTASKYQDIEYIYVAPVKTVSVAETSDNIVNVSWSKAAGVSGYMIYRKTASSGWKKLATVSGASTLKYADKSAKVSGEKYTYTVKAFKNMYGVQHCASFISGTSITFVAAPKLNEITDDANGLKVSWIKVSGAKEYTVYRSPLVTYGKTASWTKLATVSSSKNTYVDKTAQPGKAYTYTVRSEGADHRGSYYACGIYYMPEVLTTSLSETYDNKTVFKWQAVDGAAYYEVYKREYFYVTDLTDNTKSLQDSDWQFLAKTTKTNYTDSKCPAFADTTCSYLVVAFAEVNTPGTTNKLKIQSAADETPLSVKFVAAPALTSAEAEGENVKVVWEPADNAVSYTVYRKSVASDSWKNLGSVAAGGECSFVDASASASESYIYTVRSEGEANRGSYFNAGITYTPAQQVITAE